MRRSRLRRWLAELYIPPEERRADCAERCMEALYDSERVHTARLAEAEQAAIEAERRRWAASDEPAARP
jgi:hypothetical protein